ncbi:MAG: hypothetical protein ACYCOO_10985, partial [Chitinophagaceae bacterium]
RSKKIKFRKEFSVESILELFLYPDQILQRKVKSFWVYSTKRGQFKRQGLIFKQNSDDMRRIFYFVSDKHLRKYMYTTQITMFDILNQMDFKNKNVVLTQLCKQFSDERLNKFVA